MSLARKAQQLIRTHYHLPLSSSVLNERTALQYWIIWDAFIGGYFTAAGGSHPPPAVREGGKVADWRRSLKGGGTVRFNDVGYFRPDFRKYTGLTPTASGYSKEHVEFLV